MTDYVLVTGGSTGIGASIIERCGRDGYACINLDLRPPDDPSRAEYVHADLADPDAMVKAILKACNGRRITRLVNNVGIVLQAPIEQITHPDFLQTFTVNVEAAFQAIVALLPGMKDAQFGRIVNISSRSALGRANMAVYSASKAAINGLTRSCALELAAFGITVNAVGPGVISTELLARTFPAGSERRAALEASIPAKRIGAPADIAAAVSFFLREESGFVTGQVLYVCGGASVSA